MKSYKKYCTKMFIVKEHGFKKTLIITKIEKSSGRRW